MSINISGHLQIKGTRGKRRWYAFYTDADGRHQKMIGPAHVRDSGQRTYRGAVIWRAGHGPKPTPEHMTPDEAQAKLDAMLAEIRSDPSGRVPQRAAVTLQQARDEWLRHIEFDRARKRSTVNDYRSQTKLYVLDRLGADTPVGDITTERIEEWQQELLEEGQLARRTVQKAQVCLHAILKRAKKKRWVEENAAEMADRIVLKPSGDFTVLSAEEAEAVIRAAASPTDAALYRTAIGTGMRIGELRALRWQDVDFGRRLIHVRWAFARYDLDRPKSNLVRSVPMADQVAVALDELSRRERWTGPLDFVFATDNGLAPEDGRIRRKFYAAIEDAGLGHLRTQANPIRFHDLRHTFGTLAVQVAPISDVQAWMGHAQIQTTMIYVHYVPQHDAAERLTKAFTVDPTTEALRGAPDAA